MDTAGGDYLVDFKLLEDGLRQLVEHLVDRQGSFLPCGATIDKDGRFTVSAVYGGDEQPDPSQSVRDHLEAFRKRATGTRAWGVAAKVTIKAPGAGARPRRGLLVGALPGQDQRDRRPLRTHRDRHHLGAGRRVAEGSNLGQQRHRQRLESAPPLLPVADFLVLNDPGPLESATVRACVAVVDPSPLAGFDEAMAQAVHPLWPLRVALTTS